MFVPCADPPDDSQPCPGHLRCRVVRRTPPDCGWLPSNQRLGEACGGATDGQTGRYGVFTVFKCESFLLRRLGVSTGPWGGNLGFKAREVGKRPKCRVSWGKEKIHRPQALCFSGSQNSASGSCPGPRSACRCPTAGAFGFARGPARRPWEVGSGFMAASVTRENAESQRTSTVPPVANRRFSGEKYPGVTAQSPHEARYPATTEPN